MPKVSVCIPTYQSGHLISRAIQSVLDQDFNDFEIIVVDNASTDDTKTVVESFGCINLHYYRNTTNIGYPANVNKCMEYAKGDFLTILCADDFLLTQDVLSMWVSAIQAHPQCIAIHSSYLITACEKGNMRSIGKAHSPLKEGVNSAEDILTRFVKGSGFFGWSWLFSRRVIDEFGLRFETDHTMAPDTMFWLQIAMIGDVFETPLKNPAYGFMMHENSLGKELFNDRINKVYKQLIFFEDRLFAAINITLPEISHKLFRFKYRYTVNQYLCITKNAYIRGLISHVDALTTAWALICRHSNATFNLQFCKNFSVIILPRFIALPILLRLKKV